MGIKGDGGGASVTSKHSLTPRLLKACKNVTIGVWGHDANFATLYFPLGLKRQEKYDITGSARIKVGDLQRKEKGKREQ